MTNGETIKSLQAEITLRAENAELRKLVREVKDNDSDDWVMGSDWHDRATAILGNKR